MNNVGTTIRKEAVEFTAEDFSTIMVTNFESAYHLCQLAHPLLKASGYGSIVFNSSIASSVAIPLSSVYAASKGIILLTYLVIMIPGITYQLILFCFFPLRSNESGYKELGL